MYKSIYTGLNLMYIGTPPTALIIRGYKSQKGSIIIHSSPGEVWAKNVTYKASLAPDVTMKFLSGFKVRRTSGEYKFAKASRRFW